MRRPRLRGDAGAATTELVIVFPVLITLIFLIIQLGLYFHAMNVASNAAQVGAREATLSVAGSANPDLEASVALGEAAAQDFIDDLAPNLLSEVGADGDIVDDDQMVRMTVSGDVVQTLGFPGLSFGLTVSETAETPVERFRPAGTAPPTDPP
jgi:Flp pilus assembly protein TadG